MVYYTSFHTCFHRFQCSKNSFSFNSLVFFTDASRRFFPSFYSNSQSLLSTPPNVLIQNLMSHQQFFFLQTLHYECWLPDFKRRKKILRIKCHNPAQWTLMYSHNNNGNTSYTHVKLLGSFSFAVCYTTHNNTCIIHGGKLTV